jgi:hypothetical protein
MKTTKNFLGLRTCVAFVVVVILISCGYAKGQKATDYSKTEYWLSLPSSIEKEVDVFTISKKMQLTGQKDSYSTIINFNIEIT